uniref:CCHC-type domain-containing protein n=1 Tax=Moniliophthora roreri TaxID=221103 RepID=A0A0W0GCN4_MONRR
MKIMMRLKGKPEKINNWMNTAILYNETWEQAQQYGKRWDKDNRRTQQTFQKKEGTSIKKISEAGRKEYMAKGLYFQCGRSRHRVKDCPDGAKKKEQKKEEPRKMTKEKQYVKIHALVNDQSKEEKDLLHLMEQKGF